MCRGKETILSETIIYWLKQYSQISIISLSLMVFRPKLVILLTDVFQGYLSASLSTSASVSVSQA